MTLNQPLENYSDEQLREMLAEALRAQKLIEENPDVPLTTHSGYCLGGDEILTIETNLDHEFVSMELADIIALINQALDKPFQDDEFDA